MQAAFKPDAAAVKMLLGRGADVSARATLYGDALHCAATGGGPERERYWITQMLLDHGALGDGRSETGSSAQMGAIGSPVNDRIVRLLLSRGVDPRRPSPNGFTPLQYASEFGGNPEATRWLLARLPEVPPSEARKLLQKAEDNALCDACYEGDMAEVKQRLAEGADVNAYKQTGVAGNPVRLAATAQILRLLLAHGADPKARLVQEDGEEESGTLDAVALEARPEFRLGVAARLKVLLNHGLSARSDDGATALFDAQESGAEGMRVLLDYGADVNVRLNPADPKDPGPTALMLACDTPEEGGESHNAAAARLLLGRGADVHLRDAAGHTALYYARQYARFARQCAHDERDLQFRRRAVQDAEDSDGIVAAILQAGAREQL